MPDPILIGCPFQKVATAENLLTSGGTLSFAVFFSGTCSA
jgi:hypothetical protein